MTCLPYRTSDNKIDGVILTFIDVTAFKESEISMQKAHNFADRIINSLDEALMVLDQQLRVVSANHKFYESFGLKDADVLNRSLSDLNIGEWNIAELAGPLCELVEKKQEIENFHISGARRRLTFDAKLIESEQGQPALILLAVKEISQA
jgi:two-component system CheB/CheR fusion protein